jgi:hypothetical protein
MFEYKYKIEFKNGDTTSLFGEGYFADKPTFWESHQTTLNDLYKNVLNSEFPLIITDLEINTILKINTLQEFNIWITKNQPFTIP